MKFNCIHLYETMWSNRKTVLVTRNIWNGSIITIEIPIITYNARENKDSIKVLYEL